MTLMLDNFEHILDYVWCLLDKSIFLEVAASEQRVVDLSKFPPVVELAPACGPLGVQSSPVWSQQRNIVFRHDGTSPSGGSLPPVALPAELLLPMPLRNLSVHLEGFYQKWDILGGFLGWCLSLTGSTAQKRRLLAITSEKGILWDRLYSEVLGAHFLPHLGCCSVSICLLNLTWLEEWGVQLLYCFGLSLKKFFKLNLLGGSPDRQLSG